MSWYGIYTYVKNNNIKYWMCPAHTLGGAPFPTIEIDDTQPLFYEARGKLYAEVLNQPDDALADFTAAELYGERNVPVTLVEQIRQLRR